MDTMEIGFGRRLSRIMAEKGLSQVELAKKMGVSGPTVNRWIAGEDFPRYGKLMKLIRLLDCTAGDLLGSPPSIATVAETLNKMSLPDLLAALQEEGFPPSTIEVIKRFHKKILAQS